MQNYTNRNFARVDFMPEELERLIEQRGVRVRWEKSMLCSCIGDTGPDFSCTSCRGRGYLYFDPKDIRVISSSSSGGKDEIPIGLLDLGSSLITVKAEHRVGFRDRISFVDQQTPYSQVLVYQEDEEKGVEVKFPILEMVSLRIRDMEIPRQHYRVSEDGRFIKFNQGVLDDGEKFSILCRIRPTYVVIDLPHELRGQFIKFRKPAEEWIEFPKQLMIKREDLLSLRRGDLL